MTEERFAFDGRYKVLSKLGSGGMAEVYLAEQVSLGRRVALKVLRKNLAETPGMAERFRREALLLSTVDHPHVVRVLDFASGPEGTALVLEYVEGPRLDVALDAGAFSVERAVTVLRHLAQGLAAIHARGIVHRDLKPENVVLARGPDGEVARLLDFGVARLLEPDEAAADGRGFVTQTGLGTGTPAYLAPEQVHGQPSDSRTDVYAFGVTAWLLLAGRLPFEGPRLEDFLKQHVEVPAPPLPPELVKTQPALAGLVARCLAKRPTDRPADGRALVVALERMGPLTDALSEPTEPLQAVSGKPEHSGVGCSTWLLAGALSLAAALTPVVVLQRAWTPSAKARAWLALGRPESALQQLENAAPGDGEAPATRVRALFALGRLDAVRDTVAAGCHQALVPAGPVLAGKVRAAGLLPPGLAGEACGRAAAGPMP